MRQNRAMVVASVVLLCASLGVGSWATGWPFGNSETPDAHLTGPLHLNVTMDLGAGDFEQSGERCIGIGWVRGIGGGKAITATDTATGSVVQTLTLPAGEPTSRGTCQFQFALVMPAATAAEKLNLSGNSPDVNPLFDPIRRSEIAADGEGLGYSFGPRGQVHSARHS